MNVLPHSSGVQIFLKQSYNHGKFEFEFGPNNLHSIWVTNDLAIPIINLNAF